MIGEDLKCSYCSFFNPFTPNTRINFMINKSYKLEDYTLPPKNLFKRMHKKVACNEKCKRRYNTQL